MENQEFIDYLTLRIARRRPMPVPKNRIVEVESDLDDDSIRIIERYLPDKTMFGVAETPTQKIIYFANRQGQNFFYSVENKDIQ